MAVIPTRHGGAAERQALDGELDRRRQADRLEGVVRAAVGQRREAPRWSRLDRRRRGRVRRAEARARRPAWPATRSIGDDPPGAGEHRAHHDREADAAEADDRDARPGRDLGRLQHGPDARSSRSSRSARPRPGRRRRGGGSRLPPERLSLGHRPDRRNTTGRFAAVGRGARSAVGHPVGERRASPGTPTAGPRGTRRQWPQGTSQDSATGCPTRSDAHAGPDAPRPRRRPRGPSRSGSGAATRRRGRAGRSGTRRTQATGRVPRPHAAQRARPSRRSSAPHRHEGRRPGPWS